MANEIEQMSSKNLLDAKRRIFIVTRVGTSIYFLYFSFSFYSWTIRLRHFIWLLILKFAFIQNSKFNSGFDFWMTIQHIFKTITIFHFLHYTFMLSWLNQSGFSSMFCTFSKIMRYPYSKEKTRNLHKEAAKKIICETKQKAKNWDEAAKIPETTNHTIKVTKTKAFRWRLISSSPDLATHLSAFFLSSKRGKRTSNCVSSVKLRTGKKLCQSLERMKILENEIQCLEYCKILSYEFKSGRRHTVSQPDDSK